MNKTLKPLLLLIITLLVLSSATAQVFENQVFTAKDGDFPTAYFPYTKRAVYENNKVKFVIARAGDTFQSLAAEVNLHEFDLRNYNDLNDWTYEPMAGEVVYLQPKRTKCATAYHRIAVGESMRAIAQRYGITLKALFKKNIKLGYSIVDAKVGDQICISCR